MQGGVAAQLSGLSGGYDSIAQEIVESKGEYVLAVKENQSAPALRCVRLRSGAFQKNLCNHLTAVL